MHTPPWQWSPLAAPTDSATGFVILDGLLADGGCSRDDWTVEERELWLIAAPRDKPRRSQGWKLHIAATILSAPTVMARVVPILVEARRHFKVVKSIAHLEWLNSPIFPEGGSGKFITIYPDSDDDAVTLAARCHEVTVGLPGPRILSDRPWCPGSLVHYRFGSFSNRITFAPTGRIVSVIEAPDGTLVEDARKGRFQPPGWAGDPFASPDQVGEVASASGGRVGLGAYQIQAAITRSNKGGVYRARCAETARPVIIKEARSHVATDRAGRDVRDRLRNEWAILSLLKPTGITAKPIDLFEVGDHVFLVTEDLGGQTFRSFVKRRFALRGQAPGGDELQEWAHVLARLLEQCHAAGVVVRDFNPNNIIVGAAPACHLIDLELAYRIDETAHGPFPGKTPGYVSPQHEAGLRPTPADDIFSLGATLYHLAVAADPVILPDSEAGRSRARKSLACLALNQTPAWAAELIVRCLAPDPASRPTAEEVGSSTRGSGANRITRRRKVLPAPPRPTSDQLEEAIAGCVDYLAVARGWGGTPHLWPVTMTGWPVDPHGLLTGSSGVGLVLCQIYRRQPTPRIAALLEEIVAKIGAAVAEEPTRSPSLYNGIAGIAWFLAEAGEVLGTDDLVEQAHALLTQVPSVSAMADMLDGTAGIGLAAIRLHLATGQPDLLSRVGESVHHLGSTATRTAGRPAWPTIPMVENGFTSKVYPGYAYGAAGIGYFVLCAARVTGDPSHAALAEETLAAVRAAKLERDGQRWWPTSSAVETGSPYWLKGAAGIGAVMARAYRLTGNEDYRDEALDAMQMVWSTPRNVTTSQLHGLSGIGEFLLDMADLLHVAEAREQAWELARTIYTHRIDRRADGYGLLFPDDEGFAGADFMLGTSGVVAFFNRLLHRSRRLVMLDELLNLSADDTTLGVAVV